MCRRLREWSGLGQISLLATAKVPRSTGYLFGPDLMKQREASYQKKGDMKTWVGRLWVRILTPARGFFSHGISVKEVTLQLLSTFDLLFMHWTPFCMWEMESVLNQLKKPGSGQNFKKSLKVVGSNLGAGNFFLPWNRYLHPCALSWCLFSPIAMCTYQSPGADQTQLSRKETN